MFSRTASEARSVALQSFTVLRIGTAVVLLLRGVLEYHHVLDLYGQHGIVTWQISDYGVSAWLPRLSWLVGHTGQNADFLTYLLFDIYVISAVCLLCGFALRFSAVLCFVLYLTLSDSSIVTSYGVDIFSRIALFFVVLCPGVPLRLWSTANGTVFAAITLWVFRFELAIVYLSAGLEKAKGGQWWNGEAIWRALSLPSSLLSHHPPLQSWVAWHPMIPTVLGILTVVTEIGYCVMIWPRRTRAVWLSGVIGMHLFIGIALHLWAFAAIMVVLNVAAFGTPYLQRAYQLSLKEYGKHVNPKSA